MSPESDKGVDKKTDAGETHHMSDIDYWKHPDRSYYVFICLSFLLGFFGLDHFYLRSFGTGMQKFGFNMISFGLWYFWDVLQIIYEGESVKTKGLSSPFDWTRGIGRGVFAKPLAKGEKPGVTYGAKKDIIVYALLSLMTGLVGLNKFYMGNIWQGVAQIATTFNIITFFFGLAWALYDAVYIIFFTESVLKDGITVPPPYSFLFDTTPVKDLFIPTEIKPEGEKGKNEKDKDKKEDDGGLLGGLLPALPVPDMKTFRFLYRELAVPLLKPSVGVTMDKVQEGVALTEKAVDVGQEVVSTVPKVASAVTQQIATVTNPDKMIEQIQAAAAAKAQERLGAAGDALGAKTTAATAAVTGALPPSAVAIGKALQTGGGSSEVGSGPIIAGTLTAITLAGAVKVIAELLSQHQK